MGNVSLKLSLLIFILVITSNHGAESRELSGIDEKFKVNTGKTLNLPGPPRPPCKRDTDCMFTCLKDGVCETYLGLCYCF
ncbi:hypothetical protein EUTSA_v10002889mg [Eutrema salsugineum]|uniref:Knottin scorpion toxin-like domain-containing protein n=1 Tax=Eutrema salsugineum TaxID=72664 RepID=V4LBN0_EUTSA|nr:hypothetical protein EUTSA_v10002889mg [Eutrema salsugineum]